MVVWKNSPDHSTPITAENLAAAFAEPVADARLPVTAQAATLSATYAALRKPTAFGVPYTPYGSSYTEGTPECPAGYVTAASLALGTTALRNGGRGGSASVDLPYAYMRAASSAYWDPGVSTGVISLELGVNDTGPTTAANATQMQIQFEENLRLALRWFRATALIPFTDPTVDLGAWELWNVTMEVMATDTYVTGTAGNILTITPGGPSEIVFLPVVWREESNVQNGDFEVSVDGGPWRTGTTQHRGYPVAGTTKVYGFASYRITNLTPTSVVRIKKTTGGAVQVLPYYLVMDNPTPPPILLIQDVPLAADGVEWPSPGATAFTTNSTLEMFRVIMRRVAASGEFNDGTVVIADPAPYWDYTTNLSTDNIHPNASGFAVYADTVARAAQSFTGS